MIGYRQTLLVFLLMMLSGATIAQNNTNSPYTRYGYGQLADQGSGNSKAMGGVAYGLRDKYQVNFANPASYTAIDSLTRNTVGSMDFGGSALNKYYNAGNKPGGSRRVTSDVFALATAVLFQSPVQHFALAPNNLTDAPVWAMDFMKTVPSVWDEVKFIDGYPGKYILLARRHADTWYIAGVNAQKEPLKLKVKLPMIEAGKEVKVYSDNKDLEGDLQTVKLNKRQEVQITIPCNGGMVIIG